ncbi:MAG: SulP family inorganic anion transporter, partial [Bacteroidota bacterium]
MTKKTNLFASLRSDFPSGLVVFLVALPLCLGIALASGAPPLAGVIAGIVGGLVVGFLSRSHISVSGPAAGLTAIVLTAIATLGSFEVFLLSVFLAGIFQLILGFIKAGTISNYFPSNV